MATVLGGYVDASEEYEGRDWELVLGIVLGCVGAILLFVLLFLQSHVAALVSIPCLAWAFIAARYFLRPLDR